MDILKSLNIYRKDKNDVMSVYIRLSNNTRTNTRTVRLLV
jgi:hypothetical protein